MKIELFEITTDETGLLTGKRTITHIQGYRGESIGCWELPEGVNPDTTKHNEPGIFSGSCLLRPEMHKGAVVLKPVIDRDESAAWIYLKKA